MRFRIVMAATWSLPGRVAREVRSARPQQPPAVSGSVGCPSLSQIVNRPRCPLMQGGGIEQFDTAVRLITPAIFSTPAAPHSRHGGRSAMVINVGLYAACFLSLYVLSTTKPK